MASTQLDMFQETEVAVEKPEPTTEVRLGQRSAQIPLRQQRRAALVRLMEILEELEGKDIFVGSYEAGGRHFWFHNTQLRRLQIEEHPYRHLNDKTYLPGVLVLWGSRGGHVRIFTEHLVKIREQEYQGYWLYLLDFRNGFWENPIDHYWSHYACLEITRFKD